MKVIKNDDLINECARLAMNHPRHAEILSTLCSTMCLYKSEEMSPVIPEAEWIWKSSDVITFEKEKKMVNRFKCSNCGRNCSVDVTTKIEEFSPYCSSCGCKMHLHK